MNLNDALKENKIQIFNTSMNRILSYYKENKRFMISNCRIGDGNIKIEESSLYETIDLGKALNVLVYGTDTLKERSLESKIKERLNKLEGLYKDPLSISARRVLNESIKLLKELLDKE